MMPSQPGEEGFWRRRQTYSLAVAWIVIGAMCWSYAVQVGRIGLDFRDFTWQYTWPTWWGGDITSAMHGGAGVLNSTDQLPPMPGQAATIWVDEPGLLDPPLNVHNFLERWHTLRPVYARIV